jgi:hypothetical protein
MNGWQRLARASVWASGAVVACAGGTETDNPHKSGDLVAFDASACKTEAAETSGKSFEAVVATSEYDGLTCLEWETKSGGVVSFRVLNLNGGCSVTWSGDAVVRADGSLELLLTNTKCAVAACGWCLYDFQFDVRNVPPLSGLPVRIGTIGCPGETPTFDHELSLPADAGPSGILCRYTNVSAYDQLLVEHDRCGSQFGSCRDQDGFCKTDGAPECREGLVCTPAADSERCLTPCTSDYDCSPGEVSACVDGICRLTATY